MIQWEDPKLEPLVKIGERKPTRQGSRKKRLVLDDIWFMEKGIYQMILHQARQGIY